MNSTRGIEASEPKDISTFGKFRHDEIRLFNETDILTLLNTIKELKEKTEKLSGEISILKSDGSNKNYPLLEDIEDFEKKIGPVKKYTQKIESTSRKTNSPQEMSYPVPTKFPPIVSTNTLIENKKVPRDSIESITQIISKELEHIEKEQRLPTAKPMQRNSINAKTGLLQESFRGDELDKIIP